MKVGIKIQNIQNQFFTVFTCENSAEVFLENLKIQFQEYLVRFEAFVVVWAAPSERAVNSDMNPYIKHQIWTTGSKI